jgi:hypothetical protein
MFKKTIIAASALIAATVAFQPVEQAQAGVKIHIGVGIGAPGYYGGGYYGPSYHAPVYRHRISCGRAISIVRHSGFYRVRAVDCSGRRFTFHAKRNGVWRRIRMYSASGRIYKVTFL